MASVTPANATAATNTKFTFTLPDITENTARSVLVQVPEDGAYTLTGLGEQGLGNQASIEKTYTLPPVHATSFAKLEAAEDEDELATYDLTITFVDDAGDKVTTGLDPALTVDDLQVVDEGSVVFEDFATDNATDTDIVYTVTVILRAGVDTATISVDSGFAAAAEMDGSVDVSTLSTLATPSKPTFTVNSDRTVSLNWDDVTGADSYTVTQMQASEDDVTYPATGASPITASEYTTTALAVGTYTFTVKAMSDSAVDSAASPASDNVVVAGTAPTVTVSLVSGSLDVTDKEFLVDFAFVIAGMGEAPVPGSGELMAEYIKVTTDAAGMTDARIPAPMVEDLRGAGNFRATIDYTGATLPLYVSLIEADSMAAPPVMGVDVSAITYGTDATATSLMVDAPNAAPTFPATTVTTLTVVENTAAGMNIGAAITATDPGDTLTYTLGGVDAASFAIVATSGQLQTKAALEADGATAKTAYMVTVTASDSGTPALTASIDVTITVTDVADTVVPPTVTISLVSHDEAMKTFQVRFAFAAATVDPMVGTAGPVPTALMASAISVMKAGATAGTMVDAAIPDPTVTALRTGEWVATVDYSLDTDGLPLYVSLTDPSTVSMINGMAADGATTPALTVEATPVNAAPEFTDGTSATRSVAENTAAGTAIGTPVAATDADTGDTLTYSLGGVDAASFAIVATSGQLQTKAALEADGATAKTAYMVTVTATDDGTPALTASIDVTINVTNDPADDGSGGSTDDETNPVVAISPINGKQSEAFDVTFTAIDDTSTLTAASISVVVTSTNTGAATYTKGDVTAATAANTYTVTITLTPATTANIAEETLTITVTATDEADNAGNQFIVVVLDKRDAASTVPMGNVTIASKGYAVLVNTGATAAQHGIQSSVDTIEYDLPNLYEFFRDSGTIVLNGSSGTAFGAVRMTEIMWGEDAALGADSSMSQWIEIQNTTAAAITVNFEAAGGWSLTFKRAEYDNSTADAVDRISNLGNPGRWNVPGQSGRSVASGNDSQVELVSMVRKHTDARSHRSDGWEAAIRPSLNIAGARIANPGAAKAVVIVSGSSPTIDRGTVYISEIGNLGDGEDWIELYNASDSAQNIKNWIISVVEADRVAAAARTSGGPLTKGNQEGNGIDKEVVQFERATYEDALNIPAKSYRLM